MICLLVLNMVIFHRKVLNHQSVYQMSLFIHFNEE